MGIDLGAMTSLTELFFAQAEDLGGKPFLWAKNDGSFSPLSWNQVAEQVRSLAGGLRALGAKPGERIMLVSENRPEWLIADLAIMTVGCVTVPAYTTNTVHDHLHVMNDSGASIVIVSTKRLAEKVFRAVVQSNTVPRVVTIEPADLPQTTGDITLTWAEVCATGGDSSPHPAGRDDLACLIYTSGTGGAPKGVMQTHGNILHNCRGAAKLLGRLGLGDEVFLSFLPLSHSYEHTAGQFFPMAIGAQIYYAEGMDKLGSNMLEARPTLMTAVPRLYETLRARVLGAVKKDGGTKERLFNRTLELGAKHYEDPSSLTTKEKFHNKLLSVLVRRKVAGRFGGRMKAMISGGGPLNLDVGLFFQALGVPILQGYGQTESAPVISCNPPDKPKIHAVGPPLEEVEAVIAGDGEILVRGPLVMPGYWNNPKATREAIDEEGWLHTGDIGIIDEDGYIEITDRKKDIIVNSGGDNIAPQRVEGFLHLEPEIFQAMVYGDCKPHLVALIVPDKNFAAEWAEARGKSPDMTTLVKDEDYRRVLSEAVDRVNRNLSNIEKVRRYALADDSFTVDNEQLTPTLKVRRHKITEIYGERLEKLY